MKYYVKNDLSLILDQRYQAEGDRLVFRRAGKIKGDYLLADFTELEVSDEMRTYGVNKDLFKLVDGVPKVKSLPELQAEKLVKQNSDHDNGLRVICERYQHSEEGGDCNANFFALLTASKATAKALGVDLGPKTKACLDWCDALWADYYSRKGDHTQGSDFSNHGSIPHTFAEVRAESEAL